MSTPSYDQLLAQTAYPLLVRGRNESPELFRLPSVIGQNLRHALRDYQVEALEHFKFVNDPDNLKLVKTLGVNVQHQLYHAATGAGKTTLMAGSILYLYTLGYRKFIFVTNQVNLVAKTRFNLLPALASKKLEFVRNVCIDGARVGIRDTDRLGATAGTDIEILFTTIQALHSAIQDTRENSVTISALSRHKVAVFADEAHHFNTVSSASQKTEEASWETTIQQILAAHPENKLIELTATMAMLNAGVFSKYKDKLIFDYTLRKFREAGYSKEISLVQLSGTPTDRALAAILISQYRQDVAQEHGIPLVPRILFKCEGLVSDLESSAKEVYSAVAELDARKLSDALQLFSATVPILAAIKERYSSPEELAQYLARIRINYCPANSRVIHSKNSVSDKAAKMEELNSIDASATLRMVFAINILNEGWDVLSLFDIVKLDEHTTTAKATTAEAQLIGRGARIYPYDWSTEVQQLDRFKRKFDDNQASPLRLLEEMYFYSESDNAYIAAIRKGLVDVGLKSKEDGKKTNVTAQVCQATDLSSFAQRMYEQGVVISNRVVLAHSEYTELADFNLVHSSTHSAQGGVVTLTGDLSQQSANTLTFARIVEKFPAVVAKALRRHPQWAINAIHALLPSVTSASILKEQLLRLGPQISVTVEGALFGDLPYAKQLAIVTEVLADLAAQLSRKKVQKRGTTVFDKVSPVKQVFLGYSKDSTKIFGYGKAPIAGTNAFGEEFSKPFAIRQASLFYYDHISWDSALELEMYKLFDESLNPNTYLVIRNEVGFKLYGTAGDSCGQGFEPDFIVLRDAGDGRIFQYFVEVKGDEASTSATESWKEELLLSLQLDSAVEHEGATYHLVGLPFFTEATAAPGVRNAYAASLTVEASSL